MIIFHDGNNQAFAEYTGGRAWNDSALSGETLPRFATLDTETNVRALLEASSEVLSRLQRMDNGLESNDLNIHVLKRAHQPPDLSIIAYCHMTVGWDGYIWHLEVFAVTGKVGLAILDGTRGSERWQDGDGFEVVRKGKGKKR